VLFALSQSRYIKNFVSGPFDFGQPELDAIGDVSTTPRYFVKVTGPKAIETGIQQITTRKRAGVETGRSVSAAYYVLVVGDRLLVVKRADGTPTTVEGELARLRRPAHSAGRVPPPPRPALCLRPVLRRRAAVHVGLRRQRAGVPASRGRGGGSVSRSVQQSSGAHAVLHTSMKGNAPLVD